MGEQIAAQLALREALEALRDDNEDRICALIRWQGAEGLDADTAAVVETQLRLYMDRQLKWELQTSAKPMFAEMSSGSESAGRDSADK